MSKVAELRPFKGILPYSSELFGVYQPLLGWKSQRSISRFSAGFGQDRTKLYTKALDRFVPNVSVIVSEGKINVGPLAAAQFVPKTNAIYNSTLVRELVRTLPSVYSDQVWDQLTPQLIQSTLNGPVKDAAVKEYGPLLGKQSMMAVAGSSHDPSQAITSRLMMESSVAGLLLDMKNRQAFSDLKQVIYDQSAAWSLPSLLGPGTFDNPLDMIDPHRDLDRVGLSPVGIVHLFREYFFEFDTFLGTPVGHVWLSPGGSVELVEVSTRKTTVEQTIEASSETTRKTETTKTTQDDLSEAVKQDNQQNTKLGATANSSQNWVWGSTGESASFDLSTTQQNARENTHKQMRQQSSTLSEEIKTNYKTTFKTVSEVTDVSSRRYLLANNTDHLLNYELRRKMRQVGVQVQDVGTYLCWQTYVDDAGKDLGVANLVSIAKPPDLPTDPNPQSIPVPQPVKGDPITATYQWLFDDTRVNWVVKVHKFNLIPPQAGYVYDDTRPAEVIVTSGPTWGFTAVEQDSVMVDDGSGGQEKSVTAIMVVLDLTGGDGVEDDSNPSFTYQLTVYYRPSKALLASVEAANKQRALAATNDQARAFRQAYIQAASDRVTAASKISPRPYDELREEERTVVYRALVQDLLTKGVTFPDDRTWHIVAELLNSIFDVDKMLYFVSPEWWRPRLHESGQSLGGLVPATINGSPVIGADGKPVLVPPAGGSIGPESIVSWGGPKANRVDDYYITSDSTPAKLGSSLGWLLQLDGDNLRNAFLNSPWVKAVIPIRPGKERAAINWLQQVEGMNGIGPNDIYSGNEPALQGKSMIEVLQILADAVATKHQESITVHEFPDPDSPGDPASTVSATPVDQVFEHGFWPLEGGFRLSPSGDFEIFDQWIEVLPTDQVVPVEVAYDPKTGRML